jgi:hypothetical protein
MSPVAAFGFPVDGASPGSAVTFTLDHISEEGLLVPIAFPGHKVGGGGWGGGRGWRGGRVLFLRMLRLLSGVPSRP